MDDIMRHLTRSDPSGDMMSTLMAALEESEAANPVDLDSFNYSALRVEPASIWIVQLVQAGFMDNAGRVDDRPFDGGAPMFQMVICR